MDNENINENIKEEVLSDEENTEINNKLKKAEDISLPESLSAENIENAIKNTDRFGENASSDAPKKRKHKKILLRSLSAAAAIILAFTSVMVIKPWERFSYEKEPNFTTNTVKVQDYSEIENMFAGYVRKYQKYQNSFSLTETLKGLVLCGVSTDNMARDYALDMPETAVNTSGAFQDSKGSTGNNSHGETNTQVKGVDEADIIKNDGKYLYVVNPTDVNWEKYYDDLGGLYCGTEDPTENESGESVKNTEKVEMPELEYTCAVSIIAPEKNGSMKKVCTLDVQKPENDNVYYMHIAEMYVSGNRLILLVECSEYEETDGVTDYKRAYLGCNDEMTMAVCYDITDRTTPVETWRIYQDGSYISSRLIGDQLVVISNYYVDIMRDEDTVVKNCIPQATCVNGQMERVDKDRITVMEDVCDSSYIVVSTLNTDDKNTLKTQAVLGAGENVYCTSETLYATSTEYSTYAGAKEIFGANSSETQIHKFDIRNCDVKYLGCGSVEGRALNQFSIDEYNGYLRIATTSDASFKDSVSQLYVLDGNLQTVGKAEGIGEGERIKSVRFNGNTAYVVTFIQTDPLFVIDLSDPTAPTVKGELKIPGFSAYLHPVGENLVLGVGSDGNENGLNGGMKVSLFDVSNPEKPVECDKVTVDALSTAQRYVYVNSMAYYDHKALCWNGENNTMYIPYGKEVVFNVGDEVESRNIGNILAVCVDETEKRFSDTANFVSNSTEYENANEFIRTTYSDGILYGFSSERDMLISFDMNTQKQLYSLEIG